MNQTFFETSQNCPKKRSKASVTESSGTHLSKSQRSGFQYQTVWKMLLWPSLANRLVIKIWHESDASSTGPKTLWPALYCLNLWLRGEQSDRRVGTQEPTKWRQSWIQSNNFQTVLLRTSTKVLSRKNECEKEQSYQETSISDIGTAAA